MKKLFLVIIVILCGMSFGFAQNEKKEVLYVKFTSTDSLTDGKIYKRVPTFTDMHSESPVCFILEDRRQGYSIKVMHFRHKREKVTQFRSFIPDRDSLERFSVKADQIKGSVIDLDTGTIHWTKEDVWAFEKQIKLAKKVYFIDKRDTKDGIYLVRQVKLISSNNPQTKVIPVSDEAIIKQLEKARKNNLLHKILDTIQIEK